MKKWAVISLLLLVACASQSPKSPHQARTPTSVEPVFSKTLKPLIDKWIKKDPEKLESVIRDLPIAHRKNFTFAKKSPSLQKASDLFPRTFLFGNTGETIFAFNGDPKLGGYSSLEIADFDSETKRLNFYEIQFKKEPEVGSGEDYIALSADEIYKNLNNILISKANPTKCMHCHSAEFKSKTQTAQFAAYRWAGYPDWPNMYGAETDKLDQDLEAFQTFKRNAVAKHAAKSGYARYKALLWGPNNADPYSIPPNLKTKLSTGKHDYPHMPNTRMTLYASINYSRIVANLILNDPSIQNTQSLYDLVCTPHEAFQFPTDLSILSDGTRWSSGVPVRITGLTTLRETVAAHVLIPLLPKYPKIILQPDSQAFQYAGLFKEQYKNLTKESLDFIYNTGYSIVGAQENENHVMDKEKLCASLKTASRSPSSVEPVFSKTLKPLIDKWLKKNPKTMAEILPDLPVAHRSNFTFARTSPSLQKASDLFPRAILFGNTAETIFSFTGSPKLGGYSSFEIADFDENNKQVNFYEIRFKNEPEVGSDDDYVTLGKDEIFEERTNIQISRSNPAKCMHCHATYYRSPDQEIKFATYIWSDYRHWPNFYGEHDDTFTYGEMDGWDKVQFESFRKFKDALKKNSENAYARYKSLKFGAFKMDPYYASHLTERELKHTQYKPPKAESNERDLGTMPNTRLTMLLGLNYSRVIANFLANEPYVKANNSEVIRAWFCKGYYIPYEFSRSLKADSERWRVGIGTIWKNNDQSLEMHIMNQLIFNLRTQNPSWKFFVSTTGEFRDYARFISPETRKYLLDMGMSLFKSKNQTEEFTEEAVSLCESLAKY